MKTPTLTFAEQLQSHQFRLRLSVPDFARLVELAPGTLYVWMRGQRVPHPAMQRGLILLLEEFDEKSALQKLTSLPSVSAGTGSEAASF